jgi:hypothetical protein
MKYLRLFEGFGGDYYEEIGREDFLKLSLSSKIPFEGRVYVKIISLFESKTKVEWKRDSGARFVDGKLKPVDINFSCQGGSPYVEIFQIEDEYFLVSIRLGREYKSWKCDQWDGLVRLLVDEGIITQDK